MVKSSGERIRLFVKGHVLGFKRGKANQTSHTVLVSVDGVVSPKETPFYLGKRIAYIWKASTEKKGSKYRVTWGKFTRTHGNSGVMRAKFRKNLPPKSLGGTVRVMLYPSNI